MDDGVVLEYIGCNRAIQIYRGSAGGRYAFGAVPGHQSQKVSLDDAPNLLRYKVFRRVDQAADPAPIDSDRVACVPANSSYGADWPVYADLYRREILDADAVHANRLQPGDYKMKKGALCIARQTQLPLAPLARLFLETICLLQPTSVLDVGCGGGDALWNLQVLLPRARLWGFDREPKQLAFLAERQAGLLATVAQDDVTELHEAWPMVDVCYSKAVLMHIDPPHHLRALDNMLAHAKRHVVLLENWFNHNFERDLRTAFSRNATWAEGQLTLRRIPEIDAQRGFVLIASRTKSLFEPLTDYWLQFERPLRMEFFGDFGEVRA